MMSIVSDAQNRKSSPETTNIQLSTDKYQELWNFKIEVKNIFMTNSYNTQDNERTHLYSTGFAEAITHKTMKEPIYTQLALQRGSTICSNIEWEEQEECKTSKGLFEVLRENIKPHYSKTKLSLQYYKLIREQSENAERGQTTSELRQINVNIKKKIEHSKNNLLMAYMMWWQKLYES